MVKSLQVYKFFALLKSPSPDLLLFSDSLALLSVCLQQKRQPLDLFLRSAFAHSGSGHRLQHGLRPDRHAPQSRWQILSGLRNFNRHLTSGHYSIHLTITRKLTFFFGIWEFLSSFVLVLNLESWKTRFCPFLSPNCYNFLLKILIFRLDFAYWTTRTRSAHCTVWMESLTWRSCTAPSST